MTSSPPLFDPSSSEFLVPVSQCPEPRTWDMELGTPDLLVEEVPNPPALAELFDLVARRPGASFLDPDPYAVNRWHSACFGYDPFLTFSSKGHGITVSLQGQSRSLTGEPFECLRGLFQQYGDGEQARAPLAAGAIGYFGCCLRSHLG